MTTSLRRRGARTAQEMADLHGYTGRRVALDRHLMALLAEVWPER